MNKVILNGRLTADPDYRQTQNGTAVCRFTVAVNRPYQKDKEQQEADFISCQAWRGTADFVSRYFSKGKPIIVEGSLRNNNYTDQNGVKHYSMEVLVSNVEFTISDISNTQQGQAPGNYYQQPVATSYQPQQNYGYQQNSPQYPQTQPQAPRQQTQLPNEDVNQNFEQIIPDGEIPF